MLIWQKVSDLHNIVVYLVAHQEKICYTILNKGLGIVLFVLEREIPCSEIFLSDSKRKIFV